MNTLKRYSQVIGDAMEEFEDGDYVLYSEAAALLSSKDDEIAGLKESNAVLHDALGGCRTKIRELQNELSRLQADAELWRKWVDWMRRIAKKPFNLAKDISEYDAAIAAKEGK